MNPNNLEERNSILAGETVAERNTLLAMLIQVVVEMPDSDLLDMARFADVVQSAQGCMNPAEEFLTHLLTIHYTHGGLTPELVAEELDRNDSDSFAGNYRAQAELVARHQRMYPPKSAPAAE